MSTDSSRRIEPDPAEMRQALERIVQQQQDSLRVIRDNGFVFESIGREPGNWQHLAFTLYCHICEMDMWARDGLGLSVGDPVELANEAVGQ